MKGRVGEELEKSSISPFPYEGKGWGRVGEKKLFIKGCPTPPFLPFIRGGVSAKRLR